MQFSKKSPNQRWKLSLKALRGVDSKIFTNNNLQEKKTNVNQQGPFALPVLCVTKKSRLVVVEQRPNTTIQGRVEEYDYLFYFNPVELESKATTNLRIIGITVV